MKQQDELAARPVKQRPEAPRASICYLSRSSMDDAAQRPDPAARKTVHFVSLGCPKNRVDTEVMLGHTADAGWEVVADPASAEVIVVNTCGFIGEAKQESIDAILEMGRFKESGSCQRLVVTGCLSQRYPKSWPRSCPRSTTSWAPTRWPWWPTRWPAAPTACGWPRRPASSTTTWPPAGRRWPGTPPT